MSEHTDPFWFFAYSVLFVAGFLLGMRIGEWLHELAHDWRVRRRQAAEQRAFAAGRDWAVFQITDTAYGQGARYVEAMTSGCFPEYDTRASRAFDEGARAALAALVRT